MKYEVEISESAEYFLAKLAEKDRFRIIEKIDLLGEDPMPSGCIKLRGYKEALYRIRSGDYRVVYAIKKDILVVLVIEIGHRREIYR